MSGDFDPEWTQQITYPDENKSYNCPTCGHAPSKESINDITDCMKSVHYYWVRHIPPELTFTCENEDCVDVDEEYSVKLEIVINIV